MKERRYPTHPLVGVGVVLFREKKVLLVKRGKEPSKGIWTLPGGLVEVGESLRETARREILEECGLRIEDLKLVDVIDLIEKDENGRVVFHYVLVDFLALKGEGTLRAGSDVEDAKFFPLNELPHLKVPQKAQEVIKKALAASKITFSPR